MTDLYLLSELTPQQYIVLQVVREISSRTQNKTTSFTLQQNYIAALTGLSSHTIVKALDRLHDLRIITQVAGAKPRECALFQFNSKRYITLVKQCAEQKCKLTTGYGSSRNTREVTPATIIDYIVGKSIIKNQP